MPKKTKYDPEMLLREAEAHVDYGTLARKYGLKLNSVKVIVHRLRKRLPGKKPGNSEPKNIVCKKRLDSIEREESVRIHYLDLTDPNKNIPETQTENTFDPLGLRKEEPLERW